MFLSSFCSNLELLQQILITEATNTKFHEYRSGGSRAVIRADRADGHYEVKMFFSATYANVSAKDVTYLKQ